MKYWVLIFIFSFGVTSTLEAKSSAVTLFQKPINEASSEIFLVSTLDGKLHRINMENGDIIWTHQSSPILSSSARHRSTIFADPTDGTLYEFITSQDTSQERLARYGYTLVELVSMCPIQIGSKQFLCSGSKKDVWLQLSPENGTLIRSLGLEQDDTHCPNQPPTNSSILLGRSELTLSLRDVASHELLWDITLNTYHPNTLSMPKDYGLKHLSSSQNGLLVTVDKLSNEIQWRTNLNSPVVGMYKVLSDRSIHQIDVRSFDIRTLQYLLMRAAVKNNVLDYDSVPNRAILSTLYIGNGPSEMLYAMSSASHDVDGVRDLDHQPVRRLITGPNANDHDPPTQSAGGSPTGKKEKPPDRDNTALVGHYMQPSKADLPIRSSRWQITVHEVESNPIPLGNDEGEFKSALTAKYGYPSHLSVDPFKTIVLLLIIFMLMLLIFIASRLDKHSRATSIQVAPISTAILPALSAPHSSNMTSSGSGTGGSSRSATNESADRAADLFLSHVEEETERHLPDNPSNIVIGQIQFDTSQVLGQGAQGTRVFRGSLRDGRIVAVKRLLRDHQGLGTHEYKHLMEHYDNEHVIKYHWNECSSHFFYIALDLCEGTLADYAKAGVNASKEYGLDLKEVLRQTCQGVQYLHSREVLHRDLKPKNVLLRRLHSGNHLSSPLTNNNNARPILYRVVISDFGLCKTFTRTGLGCSQATLGAGTMGWIAPEAMHQGECAPDDGTQRPVKGFVGKAADVFALGCVFYYVASYGHHPFGDEHCRQYNITNGRFSLSKKLDLDEYYESLIIHLVEWMIAHDPNSRPSAEDVLQHPFFWSSQKQLQFICQVSNYIERNKDSVGFVQLEKMSSKAIGSNWIRHLPPEFIANLRDNRTYQGNSVSHLLRAMRNKHNHFMELPESVVKLFGGTQEGFLIYFLKKFPELLTSLFKWCIGNMAHEASFHEYLLPSLLCRSSASTLDSHPAHPLISDISKESISHFSNKDPVQQLPTHSTFIPGASEASHLNRSITSTVIENKVEENLEELDVGEDDKEDEEDHFAGLNSGSQVIRRIGRKRKRYRVRKHRPLTDMDEYLAECYDNNVPSELS